MTQVSFRLLLVIGLLIFSQGAWSQTSGAGSAASNSNTNNRRAPAAIDIAALAPQITVSPTSLTLSVLPDGSATTSFIIGNTGDEVLNWQILESLVGTAPGNSWIGVGDVEAPIRTIRYPETNLPKGEADYRVGLPATEGLGGPDAFGYSFVDSREPGGPQFSWIDISTAGTALTLGDDDAVQVTLPFSFPFYGVDKNTVRISSNGYLTFGILGTSFVNTELPFPAQPNDLIAAFWNDLDPSSGSGRVYYLADAANNRFIVQYQAVRQLNSSQPNTFQIILNADGTILFQYLSLLGNVQTGTVGLENSTGTIGLQAVFNSAFLEDSLAVRFRPGVPWLSIVPASGSTNPGQMSQVQVTVDAAGLPLADFNAILEIYSGDPVNNPVLLPITAAVGPADIAVSPLSLDFGEVVTGETASEVVTIQNDGLRSLALTGVTFSGTGAGAYGISRQIPTELAPGDSIQVPVYFTPDSRGLYEASLAIASEDIDEPVVDVTLTGVGVAPVIQVSPTSLSYGDILVGEVAAQTVTVSNPGDGVLEVAAPFLGGTDPAQFSVAPQTPLSINPGESAVYTLSFSPTSTGGKSADLTLNSNDPVTPQVVVSLAGTGVSPQIGVSPLALNFGTVLISASATADLTVTNNGSADLTISGLPIDEADYSVQAGGAPFILAPGQSRTVTVAFAPSRLGAIPGILTVNSDDPGQPAVAVSLSGTGRGIPDIVVAPTALEFGGIFVDSSATLSVNINNAGNDVLSVSDLRLSGANADQFSVIGDLAFSLNPGESRSVSLGFLPRTTGQLLATLTVASDDPDSPEVPVALSGTGVGQPDIAATPGSLDFGPVQVAETAVLDLVLSNAGLADLTISALNLEGPAAGDYQFDPLTLPLVLAPGASQTLQTRFTPVAVGDRLAALSILSDDPDENPFAVNLTGTGTPIPMPEIDGNPAGLDFGPVQVTFAVQDTVVITNIGDAVLQLTSLTLEGTTTGEFTPRSGFTPYNLMPGQSRELVVSFSPRTVGVKTATIRIVNNDADENPYDVPLAGEGTLPGGTPDVAANPSFLNYGDVRIDSSALRTTTISNVGTADLVVVASNILGASRSSFTITAGGGGYTLSPGQTRDVTIALNPAEVGRLNASLALNTNDPDELTFLVPLNGTITPIPVPDIAATPASVDFGTILLDSSAVRTVTLSNVGTADLNITAVNLSGAAAFSLESGGDPVTLAPGASTDLTVRFLPLAEGPVSGSLEVLSDDPDEASLLVPLAGTGMARPEADIQVSATALAFGDVLIGESAPALLFVSNVGQMTLTVSATVIEGSHAAEFGITGGGAPFALAAGESREVALSFTPVAAGAREAVLRIDSDDPDENPLMVSLSGSGVIPPNTAPEIDAIADQVLAEGASLVLPVLARDADGDAIVLAAENLPTFGSFTDNGDGSGSFSFAPGFSDSGVYPAIRVIATDNAFVPASDTVEFQLTVTELNRAPVLAAIADQQVNEGETLVIPISASDPDGNQLRFSAPALPDFVQLNDLGNGHGELHIAPRYQDSGAYPSLAVMVSDNGNPVLSDTARFDLTVIDVPDVVNPECAVTDMDPGPPFVIHVAVRDTTSGLSHIEIITATNVQVDIPSFDQGYTDSLSITGTKIDQSRTSVLTIRVFDMDGNSSTCDPVFTKLAAGIPESFNLGQNYPNPFNPTTTIEFGVAQGPLPVSLRLYDITGKQVRVLVDEVMEAGSYQVEWDGRNDLGEKVASGVYIYQMKVQGFVQTRKLMMLK